jgi:hypothetical protein
MALIKCPHCGQTVLSVASLCPKCSSELVKVAEVRPPIANYARGVMVAGSVTLALFGMAASAFLKDRPANSVRMVGVIDTAPKTVKVTPTGPISLRTISGPLKVKPKTPRADTTAPRSKQSIDSAISNARTALARAVQPPTTERKALPVAVLAVSTPASVAIETPAPSISSQPSDTLVKWSAGWANVRTSPSSDSQVVQVLRPGQQVAVARVGRGWFSVYANGRQVGYVARQLLVDQPSEQ